MTRPLQQTDLERRLMLHQNLGGAQVMTVLRQRHGAVTLPVLQEEFAFLRVGREGIADVQATIHEIWHIARFLEEGQRVYEVSPGLFYKLMETRVEGIPGEWVRLPFPSIYLRVPKGLMFVPHTREDEYPLEGMFLTVCTEFGNRHAGDIEVFALGAERVPGDGGNALYFLLHTELSDVMRSITTGEEEARQRMREGYIVPAAAVRALGGEEAARRVFFGRIRILMSLVVNAVLYMTSSQPEMCPVKSPRQEALAAADRAGPKKAKIFMRRAETQSALPYTLLGGSIQVERRFEEGVKGQRNRTPAYRILKRFCVAGHWRRQAFGPGSVERKIIWIQPYYKGPRGADEIVSKHVLA